jgi:hypothetical protein
MTYSYGLSTGPPDLYTLPPVALVKKTEDRGGGLFLFRVKPVSDGTILNAALTSTTSPARVTVELKLREGNLSLLLGASESSIRELSIPIGISESDQLITAAVVFYLFPRYIETQLIVEKSFMPQIRSIKIPLAGLLDGPCRISLGKPDSAGQPPPDNDPETGEFPENTGADAGEAEPQENSEQFRSFSVNGRDEPINVVWDQLALLYIVPPEPDEPEIMDIDDEEPVEEEPAPEVTVRTAGTEERAEQPERKTEGRVNHPEPVELEHTGSVTDQNEPENSEILIDAAVHEDLPDDDLDNT